MLANFRQRCHVFYADLLRLSYLLFRKEYVLNPHIRGRIKSDRRRYNEYLIDYDALKPIPVSSDNEHPIFVFSAGWRSGSTLVQRMLMSSGDGFLWGEPYSKSNFIRNLMKQLTPINSLYPNPKHFITEDGDVDFSDQWVANLSPKVVSLWEAHRNFLITLFARPMDKTYNHWGFKETRYGLKEYNYLNWLFPNSKFVLLYRNPIDAFMSIRGVVGLDYWDWPNKFSYSAYSCGRQWRSLVEEFLHLSNRSNVFLVKYEDLYNQGTSDKLSTFLGYEVPAIKEMRMITQKSHRFLYFSEKIIFKSLLSNLMSEVGYKF